MEKVTIDWTTTQAEFMLTAMDGEWVITANNELIKENPYNALPKGTQIKKRLLVVSRATYHTTDYLRIFCEENHPEIDFDTEFETDKPGVYARYQEKFGHDYEDGVMELQYEALKKELAKKGYELPWDASHSEA